MNRQILFRLVLLYAVTLAIASCASPTPTPLSPTATLALTRVPPTATTAPTVTPTTAPTLVPATATLAPTATRVPPTATPVKEITATLTWLGHPTFILTTSTGLTALLDPMAAVGYPVTPVNGVDLVTVSHEHSDHNNVTLAAGSPAILRGLAGSDWAKIDQTIKGVRVRTVSTFHDDTQGMQRGKNAIIVFEFDGMRIAHLGDLGHMLSDDQVKAIGNVDAVMIPVGGFYTIDGKNAAQVVAQLNPKVVIPMHYKTPALIASLSAVLATQDDFLTALGSSAKVVQTGQTIILTLSELPNERTVLVMSYK